LRLPTGWYESWFLTLSRIRAKRSLTIDAPSLRNAYASTGLRTASICSLPIITASAGPHRYSSSATELDGCLRSADSSNELRTVCSSGRTHRSGSA
jgi:hypothetical protein